MKKADVKLSYHQGTRGLPMVNVKLHFRFDLERVAAQHPEEFSDPLFPAWLAERIERDATDAAYENALEIGWMHLSDDAVNVFGDHAKVYSAGRSGGWCVVDGLPPVETWDAIMVSKWAQFCKWAGQTTRDIPYLMVDALYYHEFEQYRETIDACVAVHARDAGMVEP